MASQPIYIYTCDTNWFSAQVCNGLKAIRLRPPIFLAFQLPIAEIFTPRHLFISLPADPG